MSAICCVSKLSAIGQTHKQLLLYMVASCYGVIDALLIVAKVSLEMMNLFTIVLTLLEFRLIIL